MTQSTPSIILDAEELSHLASGMIVQGRQEDALVYLKIAVQREPNHPRANFMLGTQYAQIGMNDRAIQCMLTAADADPEFLFAPFQAGILLMTANRGAEAVAAWQRLSWLDEEHPLKLMSLGLEALVNDDYALCNHYLQLGIEANQTNEELNNDMRNILAELDRRGLLTGENG